MRDVSTVTSLTVLVLKSGGGSLMARPLLVTINNTSSAKRNSSWTFRIHVRRSSVLIISHLGSLRIRLCVSHPLCQQTTVAPIRTSSQCPTSPCIWKRVLGKEGSQSWRCLIHKLHVIRKVLQPPGKAVYQYQLRPSQTHYASQPPIHQNPPGCYTPTHLPDTLQKASEQHPTKGELLSDMSHLML